MDSTVRLHMNGVPDLNVLERDFGVPSRATSPANHAGVLVAEEVQKEVTGRLEQVWNIALERYLIYC